MTPRLIPRSTWWAGDPTNNDGRTPRPHLPVPVGTITVHYTGSRPDDSDTAEAADYMPRMQQRAAAAGKSFEYNYLIPPRRDGVPEVWEYAGAYRAAHSAGENGTSIGVQFANGVSNHPSFVGYDPAKPTVWQQVTSGQIEAYRWLRDEYLPGAGLIRSGQAAEVQHRHMPGAATICPGVSVISHWANLIAPYHRPEPPPDPEDDDMRLFKLDKSTTLFAATGVFACHVQPEQWTAIAPTAPKIEQIDRAAAVQFTFVGHPPAGYRGIWANA